MRNTDTDAALNDVHRASSATWWNSLYPPLWLIGQLHGLITHKLHGTSSSSDVRLVTSCGRALVASCSPMEARRAPVSLQDKLSVRTQPRDRKRLQRTNLAADATTPTAAVSAAETHRLAALDHLQTEAPRASPRAATH
jgi:hypothetical protein